MADPLVQDLIGQIDLMRRRADFHDEMLVAVQRQMTRLVDHFTASEIKLREELQHVRKLLRSHVKACPSSHSAQSQSVNPPNLDPRDPKDPNVSGVTK